MEMEDDIMPTDSEKPGQRADEGRGGGRKGRVAAFMSDWVKPIVIVVIVVGSFRSAVADWNDVPSGSMKPSILIGDRILVNKLAYDLKVPFTRWRLFQWADPHRGEVVVFFSPDKDIRMVKRVVGVPGDTVALYNNLLLINGEAAEYEPIDVQLIENAFDDPADPASAHLFSVEAVGESAHPIMLTPGRGSRRTFSELIVPEGHYFLMGDNRDNSQDSRWFGLVPRERIVGRTSRVALSFDPAPWTLFRWDRFLHPLP